MSKSVRRLSAAATAGTISVAVLSTLITGTTAHAAAPANVQTPSRASSSKIYTVRPGDTLSGIAARHGISLAAVFAANKMGMRTVIYPGQKINVGTAAPAPAAPKQAPTPARSSAATHAVVPGETLSGIAARHGVTLASVLEANNLQMRSIIYPGQKILVKAAAPAPAAKQVPAPPARPAPSITKIVPAPGGKNHTVRPGDTLAKIAARYGVSLSSVLQGNGMHLKTVIRPGQKIKIGTAAAKSSPAPVKTRTTANPSSAQLKTMVADTARRMGVEPSLALAFARQESSFRQHVTSSAGAIGTMQVMPASGEWAAQLVGRPLDLRNAQDNITAGVAIISALLSTSPTKEIAIASYYQGQYSVMNRGMYEDTKDYVASVLKHQKRFR